MLAALNRLTPHQVLAVGLTAFFVTLKVTSRALSQCAPLPQGLPEVQPAQPVPPAAVPEFPVYSGNVVALFGNRR